MKIECYRPQLWSSFVMMPDQELLAQARVDTFTGSGKGGQKRNRTANAIRITLKHLTVKDEGSRSKDLNIKRAIRKLRIAIAVDIDEDFAPRSKLPGLPNEMKLYLLNGSIQIQEKNPLYPLFVGYFIDFALKHQGNIQKLSEEYKISKNQIRKFIKINNHLRLKFGAIDQFFSY